MVFVVLASKKCHSFIVPAIPRSLPPPTPLCMSQFALVNHACARVEVRPLSLNSPQESLVETSPTPPSPPSPPDETIHGHGYRRRHEEQEDEDSPEEQECCRWLNVVDVECVCPLLIRLPNVFLRLAHNYTVVVSESCRVTYQCGELDGV